MGKVIGVVPHPQYSSLTQFVVEYDSDWWIGTSTVYHNPEGKRAGTRREIELCQIVKGAENKIAADLFTPREFTWVGLMGEYEQLSTAKVKEDSANFILFLLGCVITILLYFMIC